MDPIGSVDSVRSSNGPLFSLAYGKFPRIRGPSFATSSRSWWLLGSNYSSENVGIGYAGIPRPQQSVLRAATGIFIVACDQSNVSHNLNS